MRNPGPLGKALVLASVFVVTMFFVACEQTKSTSPSPVAAPQAASTEKVLIEFEGPWAFAPDPKNAAMVVAIAPKTKGHRDLYVSASNQSTLPAGTYDLSLPDHSGPAAATADPDIAQAKIDAASLQAALDKKSARYVIRLPKPEAYIIAGRSRSRVSATYPPDASTEKEYATAVALRYNVSSMSGFSLAGTPDSGTFNPLLLHVEAPRVRFILDPAMDDDPKDKCDTHSRESFHDLAALLNVTLYIDFSENPPECHSKDPQMARPVKAQNDGMRPVESTLPWGNPLTTHIEMISQSRRGNLVPDRASSASGSISFLATAIYFFGRPSADCKAPVIILTPTP
jgi:hypothetical protein